MMAKDRAAATGSASGRCVAENSTCLDPLTDAALLLEAFAHPSGLDSHLYGGAL